MRVMGQFGYRIRGSRNTTVHAAPPAATSGAGRRPWGGVAAVAVLGLGLFAIRLAGPPDLMDFDQQRQAAYVMDAVRNCHWVCQRDELGAVCSKPPLYTWLAAAASVALGRVDRFTLCLPAGLATAALGCLVFAWGRRAFGPAAGYLAAGTYLLSLAAARQAALARTDGLFALTVALAAVAGFRAWARGGSWMAFWLAAAAATLTKGPLGVTLAGAGLLAALGERGRSGEGRAGEAPTAGLAAHVMPVLAYLALTLGWVAAAYAQYGPAVTDRLFRAELAAQSLQPFKDHRPGARFYFPVLYFLTRFAPWSLPACVGVWRAWRRPASDRLTRRCERFLACWLVGGLVVLAPGSHQRPDYVLPLIPPAALLAGRELARWLGRPLNSRGRAGRLAVDAGAALVVAVGLGFFVYDYHVAARRNRAVRTTVAAREFARSLDRIVGPNPPLTHVDDPYAIQFYRGTMQPCARIEQAARLLAGPEAAYVAVFEGWRFQGRWGSRPPPLYTLASVRLDPEVTVTILSNRPRFDPHEPMAVRAGPLVLRLRGVRFAGGGDGWFALTDAGAGGTAAVTNDSGRPRTVRLILDRGGERVRRVERVGPGQTWTWRLDGPGHGRMS